MRIQVNLAKVGWTRIDGQLVIYRPENEKYFVCNETSEFIWQILIEKAVTVQELIQSFQKYYDCEPDLVEADILQVIELLKEESIILVEETA
ncbi:MULTISPECIES: PqqD family protein [Laceyella]|uniref:PqqD family protein n=2 Tax=Laceyella TaxID=292635 RepID=A0ABY5U190_LACSH|nr:MULTISPECIES: PqqD family protein [Laceyella]PRZ16326.1 coenzyme PQQ synthesis protein D (PqqD) [Laceyella sediminis]UWE03412.1 PqqD family protein [Laceyella sacchari]